MNRIDASKHAASLPEGTVGGRLLTGVDRQGTGVSVRSCRASAAAWVPDGQEPSRPRIAGTGCEDPLDNSPEAGLVVLERAIAHF